MKHFLFLVLLGLFSCSTAEKKTDVVKEPVIDHKAAEEAELIIRSEILQGQMKKLTSSGYLRASQRQNLSTIEGQVDDFNEAVKYITNYRQYPELKPLTDSLHNLLIKIQLEDFPELRKQYASLSKDRLWEENVEVYNNGERNEYIQYVGGAFINNKTKQSAYNSLEGMLKKLRFKEVQFKWRISETDKIYQLFPVSDEALY